MTSDYFNSLAVELEIRVINRDPETIVIEFFDAVAQAIVAFQPEFLGHLKGFCKGQEGDHLQISYVSARTGVQVNGQWHHPSDSVLLTLNINVLGIEETRIKTILNEVLSRDDFQGISYSSGLTPL